MAELSEDIDYSQKLKKMARRIQSISSPEVFNLDKYIKQKEPTKTEADAWRRGDYKALIREKKDEGN